MVSMINVWAVVHSNEGLGDTVVLVRLTKVDAIDAALTNAGSIDARACLEQGYRVVKMKAVLAENQDQ